MSLEQAIIEKFLHFLNLYLNSGKEDDGKLIYEGSTSEELIIEMNDVFNFNVKFKPYITNFNIESNGNNTVVRYEINKEEIINSMLEIEDYEWEIICTIKSIYNKTLSINIDENIEEQIYNDIFKNIGKINMEKLDIIFRRYDDDKEYPLVILDEGIMKNLVYVLQYVLDENSSGFHVSYDKNYLFYRLNISKSM